MLNARHSAMHKATGVSQHWPDSYAQALYLGSALSQLCVQQHALMAGQQQVNKHTLAQAVKGQDCQVPLVSLVSNQNGS